MFSQFDNSTVADTVVNDQPDQVRQFHDKLDAKLCLECPHCHKDRVFMAMITAKLDQQAVATSSLAQCDDVAGTNVALGSLQDEAESRSVNRLALPMAPNYAAMQCKPVTVEKDRSAQANG